MNILIIAPYLPTANGFHAGGVCMGMEKKELEKKHNVYCLSFIQDEREERDFCFEESIYKGHNFCVRINKKKKILAVFLHPLMPNQFAARNIKEFKKKLDIIIKEKHIQVIHADYAVMGQFLYIKKRYPDIQFNIVLHDVTYQSYCRQLLEENNLCKKIYLLLQSKLILKYEKEYIFRADNVMVFTNKDKDLISKLYHRENSDIINTFFDLDRELEIGSQRLNNSLDILSYSICYLGQMGRPENSNAANRLLDIVDGIGGNKYEVFIVGNGPLEELIRRESLKYHITGFVNDVNSVLSRCKIAVFPLSVGAGIKVKVLHCMALGIPVITTSVGAEGIDGTGEVLIIKDDHSAIADEIQMLISDEKKLKEISRREMEYVARYFSWSKTSEVFERLYGG